MRYSNERIWFHKKGEFQSKHHLSGVNYSKNEWITSPSIAKNVTYPKIMKYPFYVLICSCRTKFSSKLCTRYADLSIFLSFNILKTTLVVCEKVNESIIHNEFHWLRLLVMFQWKCELWESVEIMLYCSWYDYFMINILTLSQYWRSCEI